MNKVQGISGKVDHVRTAYIYKEKSWSAVMQQRQNRDQLIRGEKFIYELDEVASAYGEYKSLKEIEQIKKKDGLTLRYQRIK